MKMILALALLPLVFLPGCGSRKKTVVVRRVIDNDQVYESAPKKVVITKKVTNPTVHYVKSDEEYNAKPQKVVVSKKDMKPNVRYVEEYQEDYR